MLLGGTAVIAFLAVLFGVKMVSDVLSSSLVRDCVLCLAKWRFFVLFVGWTYSLQQSEHTF